MLRLIEPKDVAFEWERVRAGLLEVKKATPEDWIPEDAYLMIANGNASLWIAEGEQGEYLGFVILRHVPTFHDSKLFIWCAYSATKVPLMRRCMPKLVEIAKSLKASKIGFSSARDEWHAAAERIGFKAVQVSYEMDI